LDSFGESHGNEYNRGRRKEFNAEFTEGAEKKKEGVRCGGYEYSI
jgi:hypothetical protein